MNQSNVEVIDHEHICYGNTTFTYVVPSLLHMSAYGYALYLFRIHENEQLKSLMERVSKLPAFIRILKISDNQRNPLKSCILLFGHCYFRI